MNSDFVKNVKEMNPGKNIKLNVVGGNVMSKFKAASTANKEFIKSLLFIGQDILNMISLPMCIKKLGYEWGEIGNEGLYLVKKLGRSILQIDCIRFDVLAMFSIQKTLDSLGIRLPTLNLPKFDIIDKILNLSNIDIITPLKNILNSVKFDPNCIWNINEWSKDGNWVDNCIKNSNPQETL